jgi:hypothetical protein
MQVPNYLEQFHKVSGSLDALGAIAGLSAGSVLFLKIIFYFDFYVFLMTIIACIPVWITLIGLCLMHSPSWRQVGEVWIEEDVKQFSFGKKFVGYIFAFTPFTVAAISAVIALSPSP